MYAAGEASGKGGSPGAACQDLAKHIHGVSVAVRQNL